MTSPPAKRILVVEDEALIAAMLQEMLQEMGAVVVGPAATLAAAEHLASSSEIDGAILDVNIRGDYVEPVASILASRGVAFVLATGYGKEVSQRWPEAPVVEKPYMAADIQRALTAAGITLHFVP